MDWHLVGDSPQPLGTEEKEAQAFAMSSTMNSPSVVKFKMSKADHMSLQHLQGLDAQESSLVSALVDNISDAWGTLSTWLLGRLKGRKLHSG